MQNTWRTFLEQQGAHIYRNRVTHYHDLTSELLATESGQVMIDLSHKGLIRISGADATRFLQGQLTCNVLEVDTEHSRFGAHCNAKGRILTSFRLFKHGDDFLMFVPGSIIAASLAQLQKYAIFSKVTISDDSSAFLQCGISGSQAENALKKIFARVPAEINQLVNEKDYIILRIPGLTPRYIVFATPNVMPPLWEQLKKDFTPAGADCWQYLNIQNGIPTIYPATIGRFTPHQVNLQLINGVSFNKGCYTGQEVIARMQHLGKLKTHMYRGHLHCPNIPKPGFDILALHNNEKTVVGSIVIAKADPHGGYQLLAAIKDEYIKNDCCFVDACSQNYIRFLELPYRLINSNHS
ncbi:MAG: folate-binding protein YgfZ [Legionellales bacterium]|nr:folate-binding protein YgfZ [Legionellales bacterium]